MAVGATGTPTVNFSIPRYATGADAPNGSGFNSAMDFIDNLLKEAPMSSKITGLVDGDAVVWDTTTGTWVRVTGTKDGTKFLRDDGTWAAAVPAAFSTYVPVWTSTGGSQPSLGNGAISGRYIQVGKLVVFRIYLGIGSTTTFGSAAWKFSLPVACSSSTPPMASSSFALDSSAGNTLYGLFGTVDSGNGVVPVTVGQPCAYLDGNVPFVWASGDNLYINGTYEAA